MESSCSFRITRTTEDLAQTVTAISQRLIKLEQQMEALELKVTQPKEVQSDEELVMLDGVDQLLQECKGLLNTSSTNLDSDEFWTETQNETNEENMAA
ncbi:chemotaxis protein [Prochlorococcus marinus]|uniref:chemotaxis protein n=1 Tax=Prochlorococcus marinus TaxID=1219 RepID=UPI0022B3C4F0|nr:chemotaxis protein [Prochlorococcus marinus]